MSFLRFQFFIPTIHFHHPISSYITLKTELFHKSFPQRQHPDFSLFLVRFSSFFFVNMLIGLSNVDKANIPRLFF